VGAPLSGATGILTFLIADVRGYTAFTQARGDEAAGRLAAKFAEIAREGVEAHGGEVVELRGDEVMAVFTSAREAMRGAVELVQVLADEVELDPSLPLRIGAGIDAGEAVPVEGGYRGGALNLAARLCSQARAGEVLVSQGVTHLARALDGIELHDYGEVELKGLPEPVRVFRVAPEGVDPDTLALRFEPNGGAPAVRERTELPPALDPVTPIVGRDLDVRRLRWAWRLARRGKRSAVVAVTGPSGIGKTRLVAEGAQTAAANGASVAYVSFASGDRTQQAAAALSGGWPAYVVFDDLESAEPTELENALTRVSTDGWHGLALLVFMTNARRRRLRVLYADSRLRTRRCGRARWISTTYAASRGSTSAMRSTLSRRACSSRAAVCRGASTSRLPSGRTPKRRDASADTRRRPPRDEATYVPSRQISRAAWSISSASASGRGSTVSAPVGARPSRPSLRTRAWPPSRSTTPSGSSAGSAWSPI
jgi:class 3 adenylate cyclase